VFGEASSLFRGTCISATLYAILFLSHIVAAAQDWDFMFRCIAASITLLTFSVGPSIQVLGKIQQHQEKMKANAFGLGIGIVLSFGLAWAYADQSIDIPLFLIFVTITVLLHTTHRWLLNQKQTPKMG
tara:strand:+ start:915 stop:1298 length:384 start_codon:yes stop_codon:yes gene_type:complete